jgi:hypothetical protein
MSHITDILLDPSIRNWVFISIAVVMYLQGVLRHYISVLLKDDVKSSIDKTRKANLLKRIAKFRLNCCYLIGRSFDQRKKYYQTDINKDWKSENEGLDLLSTPISTSSSSSTSTSSDSSAAAPAPDPMAMMGPMKQNLLNFMPNMLLMGFISYFFSGFIVAKLPFHTTDRFRSMFQRGIALEDLDVSYVSSLSWYFLTLFGVRGLYLVTLGNDKVMMDNTEMMVSQMNQMNAMGGAAGNTQDGAADMKLLETEKNEIEILTYRCMIEESEQRLLKLPITP